MDNNNYRLFAWTVNPNDSISIETYGYDDLEKAKDYLKSIKPKYDNYVIVKGPHQIQKTWEYLIKLHENNKDCTDLCTAEEV